MQFPNTVFKPKKDRRAKVRDGANKLLYISCAQCGSAIMIYQKDGRGQVLRCYYDRILWPKNMNDLPTLTCPECKNLVGVPMVYAAENRKAYRITAGTLKMRQ